MSQIQIIATIGPRCKDLDTMSSMTTSGMSLARLNFSWGTLAEHREFVHTIRAAAQSAQTTLPIVQDLPGPRIQAGAEHSFDQTASVITKRDVDAIAGLADLQPEYIALSFVATAADIEELRTLLKEHNLSSKVIAKIERAEALNNLDEIIAAADGIMIARGDLGEAIPYETLPFVKKDILARCRTHNTPAIVATEMLTSMIDHDRPSRADVTDIAQAVLDGASATMLSNETAVGEHPIEAVAVMRRVVDEAATHTEHNVTSF